MNNIQTVGATRGSPAIQRTTPVRKQIRLKSWDYSTSGWYFITICTQNRECLFGNIAVGATRGSPVTPTRGSPATIRRDRPIMVLNNNGNIVQNIWETLPNHHPVELDTFQIMPNHIHFIVHIIDAGGSRPIDAGGSRPAPTTTTLGTIIVVCLNRNAPNKYAVLPQPVGRPLPLFGNVIIMNTLSEPKMI